MFAALEGESRSQELAAEAARLELGADEVRRRDEVLEVVVADDDPLVAGSRPSGGAPASRTPCAATPEELVDLLSRGRTRPRRAA